ncbi:MAG: zinc carboxypeptidase, partial [Flavisolibacter sp.]|nr:zinc carboxypeptidase [Flavisolibacter sp.]
RFNHYWFDLNRDWLPAVHIESQNRLRWFHLWKPNILTDHHEQGSNATFFFQPGVPSRVNPLTPAKNQDLTTKMAQFHAAFLDRIGSLYFTKENYDDFYYGKGSTYPDVNGAVGILFEQASSRGHAQQTVNGILRFPFTIKNQFTTTLSTLEAAKALRKEFLQYQRDFYHNAATEAAAAPVKGYVFGNEKDKGSTTAFITMMRLHQIDVYRINTNMKAEGTEFKKGTAYVVPGNQPQHRLIRGIFEKTLNYKDSLFYDITAWTMPLAFGLPYAELTAAQFNNNLLGEKVTDVSNLRGDVIGGKSTYAYLLEWSELYAPAALYALLSKGIAVKVATHPFRMRLEEQEKGFSYGTLLIPVQLQTVSIDSIFSTVRSVADQYSLTFYAVTTGSTVEGSDLGSSYFFALSKPTIAMITGAGVNATDAGEVWYLLDQRFNIPVTHLEPAVFNRTDLAKYTTIILVGGMYNELNRDKLRSWVQSGGILILTEEAVRWAAQNGIGTVTFKRLKSPADSATGLAYVDKDQIEGAQQMRGAIFRAEADLSHPLAYGYTQPYVSLFKANRVYMERSKNPFNTPFYYKDKPLQSGWLSQENYDALKNSAAVVVSGSGSGKIVSIADDPNFRAFWLGGSKLMMNTIFFGKIIDVSTSPAD